MTKRTISVIFLSALLILLGFDVARGQSGIPKDLDRYMEQVRKEFEVPGISLAIVKDGKVVLAKGYGVRKLGDATPVDGRTLFGIASNTKAFTATALALFVEEGKIEWDAPVIRYLPWFRLSNPFVTNEITVRDLLVHRSGLGLGAGDLLWWPPSTYDRKEIVRRLSNLPLATSFRSSYAYDNVLYTVAGELIETISGVSWEEFVDARILKRVGMQYSNVRHTDASSGNNISSSHAKIGGRVRVVDPFGSDNTNPAGGINSCAEDMAKWMIVQLDSGKVSGGERLFTPRTTRQLWTLVTPMPIGEPAPELAATRPNFRGYALGFETRDYRGKKLVTHTGGLPGFVSRVMMVPELKLGIAVLTNQEIGAAFESVTYKILDHHLGAKPYDWVAAYKAVRTRTDSLWAAADAKAISSRNATSQPSLPLTSYAGTYTDAWYGDVVISLASEKLEIRFAHTPSLTGTLEHYQYDTFIARWSDPELRADAYVSFSLKPDGNIEQARMKAVSPSTDFSFDFHDLLLKPSNQKKK